jgi:hypothetical protein
MNVAIRVITGSINAQRLAAFLIAESAWFQCTPLPNDEFEFQVETDRAILLAAV